MSAKRKLAAIMFTDIVGYTALMGSDEDMALEVLRKSRDIHIKNIKQFKGILIKEMGDGMLAQFDTAIDSVLCAIEIQKQSRHQIKEKIRIGIHLGDITFDHKDIFGDGVNIASRLQSVADPGGVYISESIQKAIRAKSTIRTKYLGQVKLKNVDFPVNTYCILEDGLPVPSATKIEQLKGRSLFHKLSRSVYVYIILLFLIIANVLWFQSYFKSEAPAISSLLILPFDNFTGDTSLEYIVEGMHDALIGDVGKISALRVPSKRTANAYRNVEKSIPQIATELKIDAAIETSLSCYGDNICIQVKLVSAFPEEKQLWVHEFNIEKEQLSNLSKKIAKEISQQINLNLTPMEEKLLAEAKPIDPEAYEAYLRGMAYWELGTKPDLDRAMGYFQLSSEIDPNYALAYLGISRTWGGYVQHGFLPYHEVSEKVNVARKKAIMLDSSLVEIRAGMATKYTWGDWNWQKAEQEFLKAIEINPNYAFSQAYYSHFLAIMGDPEKGLPHSKLAMELDPFNTLYMSIHGQALKNAGKFHEALELLQQLYEIEPDQGIALPALWAVYQELGDTEKALDIAKKIYILKENELALKSLEQGFKEGGYQLAMQRTAEMMISQRDSIYFPSWQIFTLFCRAEMKEEALYWLEKAYEEHDSNMPYISIDPLFDFLREEPGFRDLLKKMDLPIKK
ncbi:adenylate/guanylate cyclase domain-containing protein [uncultured Eudoraea sp.]|uniref:adenylate/guanylate cyclase domain-containing protein n=1 Tax=uncultured Eudoraea sp. TaxID=1035614 RepID=UPI002618602C|nr:adenylate/guanylate cyclase domain-containing protein [uncultured Eudoraea sp.]